MARVGVIGCGLMGTAVAQRLVAAGFEVLAYDIDAAKREAIARTGAKPEATAAAVIAGCEVNVVCVFDTAQVEAVIEGPGGGLDAIAQGGAGTRIFAVSTTVDPGRLAALAARVEPGGARIVEYPVSGTSAQVARGDGVGLTGGDPAMIQRAAPVLDAICPTRHYLGDVGNASRAKLAVNLILGLNRAALAEGLVFAARLGLEPVAFLEVARQSAAASAVMGIKGPLMANREYMKVQSRVDQSLKDFRLMLEQARVEGQALPFASVYAQMMEDCLAHGEGEWDNAAILEAIRRRT